MTNLDDRTVTYFDYCVPHALPAEISRLDLFEKVEQAQFAKLVFVVAPSGYGKTTFLAQLARASGERAVWLSLGDQHTGPSDLERGVVVGLKQVVADLPDGLDSDQSASLPVHARALTLARALDMTNINLCIVLDGAHVLSEEASGWLEMFALALGEGHRLYCSGYNFAAARLAKKVASGEVLLLEAPDLAFTPAEAQAFLSARGYTEVKDPTALHHDLDGWPAGIALAAIGSSAYLSNEDLLEGALANLPPDVRQYLPEASIVEPWREDVAELLGCALPRGWLNEVRRSGLPVIPLDRRTFRPHVILKEALDADLKTRPERYRALNQRAGHEAEVQRDAWRALDHYFRAEQLADALRVAQELVARLRRSLDFASIRKVLERFDPQVLTPPLEVSLGLAFLETGEVKRGEYLLLELRRRHLERAQVCFALGDLASRRGEVAQQLALAEEGLAYAEGTDAVYLLQLKAAALEGFGRFDDALAVARQAVDQAQANPLLLAATLTRLQSIQGSLGDTDGCERSIRQALTIYEALNLLSGSGALLLSNDLSELYRLQGRMKDAALLLEKALVNAERSDSPVWSLLLETRGDVHLYSLDFASAASLYLAAAEQYRRFGYDSFAPRAHYKASDAFRLGGDTDATHGALAQARSAHLGEAVWMSSVTAFYEALEAFAAQALPAAKQGFETAARELEPKDRVVRSRAYLAEIARLEGRLTAQHAADLCSAVDALGTDVLTGADAKPLNALYQTLEVGGWLHGRLLPYRSASEHHASLTKPHLRITTLGRFDVTLNGQPVKLPLTKSEELLVWLALHGPSTREQLTEALWDGSNEYRHVEYFKVALRRLRAALTGVAESRANPLPFVEGKYRLTDEFRVSLDVSLVLAEPPTDDLSAQRLILDRSRSTFLPNVTTEWVNGTRERLRDSGLQAAMAIGNSQAQDDPADALHAYQEAVTLDPIFIDAHLALITLLHKMGNKQGAQRAYIAYAQMVNREYGEVPDVAIGRLVGVGGG